MIPVVGEWRENGENGIERLYLNPTILHSSIETARHKPASSRIINDTYLNPFLYLIYKEIRIKTCVMIYFLNYTPHKRFLDKEGVFRKKKVPFSGAFFVLYTLYDLELNQFTIFMVLCK